MHAGVRSLTAAPPPAPGTGPNILVTPQAPVADSAAAQTPPTASRRHSDTVPRVDPRYADSS